MAIFLLERIGTRLNKNGTPISYGIFVCSFCRQEFEKRLDYIKYGKSCGCSTKKLISEGNKGKKRTEEQKENYSKAFKGKKKSETHKQKLREAKIGKKLTEECKQKIKDNHVDFKGEKNPMFGKYGKENPNFGSKRTIVQRQKMSERQKGKKLTEEHIQKLKKNHPHSKLENSPNWQGGLSFLPYSPEFNKELKHQILERDNYTCQNSNCEHLSERLDVHHIDYDKQNNNPENLTTLCKSCHIRTNYNREYWLNYYSINKRKLSQKNIIICGGMGLLGKTFTESLLLEGANLFIIDLPYKIKNVQNKGCFYFGLDLTDEVSIKEILSSIFKKYKHIDIIISCTAINPIPKEGGDNSFENYPLIKWRKTLDVNLTSVFIFLKESIKYMLKNKNDGFKGTIINIASDLGVIAPDHSIYENGYIKPPDYCISKAGLIHLSKYIASYYRDKIKSVCLVPGSVYNGQSDTLKKNLIDRIPSRRLAEVDEYNEAIKFLCSSGSDYMNGQSLVMDGGRTIW